MFNKLVEQLKKFWLYLYYEWKNNKMGKIHVNAYKETYPEWEGFKIKKSKKIKNEKIIRNNK